MEWWSLEKNARIPIIRKV